MPSCASTEKIPVRRQIWPSGSRLGLSEISHWQACYLGQNVPLNAQLCIKKKKKKKKKSDKSDLSKKRGRRRSSLIFLVFASQKLRSGFE